MCSNARVEVETPLLGLGGGGLGSLLGLDGAGTGVPEVAHKLRVEVLEGLEPLLLGLLDPVPVGLAGLVVVGAIQRSVTKRHTPSPADKQTHTHTHAHKHIHMHTYIHTRSQHIHTHNNTHTQQQQHTTTQQPQHKLNPFLTPSLPRSRSNSPSAHHQHASTCIDTHQRTCMDTHGVLTYWFLDLAIVCKRSNKK